MSAIVGPIPPYTNPPIQPQFFQPSRFVISAISLGPTTTVTTSINHNYVIGQEVRLLIPNGYGSTQLNGQQGIVLSIPASNQVVLDIFSIGANAFVNANISQQPQIIAIGDINNGIVSATGRIIPSTNVPGSFVNISPL